MPIPLQPHHLMAKLDHELQGLSEERQIAILRRYLSGEIPTGWRGPYKVLRDRLQRQIAQLETRSSTKSASHQDTFHIPRQGDGRVCLIGGVNVGKSALVSTLTAAPAEVGDYPFTTQTPLPGMLQYEGASIQVLDTPAFVPGLAGGEGSGRRLLHLVSVSDAVCVVIDLSDDPLAQMRLVLDELAAVRCELLPNAVSTEFRAKGKGGIKFTGYPVGREDQAVAQTLLSQRHVPNGEVFVRRAFSADELIRQVEGTTLLPAVIAAHKNDAPDAAVHLARLRDAFPQLLAVETNFLDETGLPELKATLLERLGLARLFMLERPDPGAEREVFYVTRGSSVEDVAEKWGIGERSTPVTARVWGTSAQHDGQVVGATHLVAQDDAVYLKA